MFKKIGLVGLNIASLYLFCYIGDQGYFNSKNPYAFANLMVCLVSMCSLFSYSAYTILNDHI